MKGGKAIRVGLFAAAAAVLARGVGLLATQVSAAAHGVDVGDATAAPGDQATVDVSAHDITAPGLGAWTLDIDYDPMVVSVASCAPQQGGVCNTAFGTTTVRITGASASGLLGDTVLGSITFDCDAEGTSALTLAVNVFADATIGDPQDIDPLDVGNGSITCEEAAPEATATTEVSDLGDTGTGGPDGGNGLGWLIAALALAGTATIAGFAALRLRSERS